METIQRVEDPINPVENLLLARSQVGDFLPRTLQLAPQALTLLPPALQGLRLGRHQTRHSRFRAWLGLLLPLSFPLRHRPAA